MRNVRGSRAAPVLGATFAAILVFGVGGLIAGTLQDAYDDAGPGEGYDKLVILERGQVYTGSLIIPGGVDCCLRGNDAVCTLGGLDIRVSDGANLDIFDTVIMGQRALWYQEGASGLISGNTICDGLYGVRCLLATVTIENNLIVNNSVFGIAVDTELHPVIRYNDVWNNAQGNYMEFCSG